MAKTLTLPPDFGDEVASALRWYGDSKPAKDFTALVKAEAKWKPTLPRLLIRAAHRQSVQVDGERLLLCVLPGFSCSRRLRFLQNAMMALRQAIKDVAEGRESGLIYADGRDLLTLDEGPPHRPWCDGMPWPGIPPESALRLTPIAGADRHPVVLPSPADGMGLPSTPSTPAPSTPAPAPAATPAPASSAPRFPRGTIIERRR